jgi:hypothetical protein
VTVDPTIAGLTEHGAVREPGQPDTPPVPEKGHPLRHVFTTARSRPRSA